MTYKRGAGEGTPDGWCANRVEAVRGWGGGARVPCPCGAGLGDNAELGGGYGGRVRSVALATTRGCSGFHPLELSLFYTRRAAACGRARPAGARRARQQGRQMPKGGRRGGGGARHAPPRHIPPRHIPPRVIAPRPRVIVAPRQRVVVAPRRKVSAALLQ